MSSLLPLLVVGFIAFAIAWWRARSQAIGRLTDSITRLRAIVARPTRRRPAAASHPVLQRRAAQYEQFARDLASDGGVVLGDSEEIQPDGSSAGVTRWFRDRTGQVTGWYAVVEHPSATIPAMYILSELVPTTFFVTHQSTVNRVVAAPPTVVREHLAPGQPVQAVLALHRQRLPAGANALTVGTIEEAQAMVDRLRSHIQEWRTRQDQDQLIDLDLRSVLGAQYDRVGPAVARRIRQRP
ncbi:MAG: hypothetical protein U0133_17815 [Gemmatimonadales bacterium]